MSSFTPGPWAVEDAFISSLTSKDAEVIFEAFLPYATPKDKAEAEMAANLRLAAAAPEMVGMLKKAMYEFLKADNDTPLVDEIEALLGRIDGEEEAE